MAKQLPEITGFSIGGIVPLAQVGFVMKEFYERGGTIDLMQPFAETRKPNGKKHLTNTSGVSGLLAPPKNTKDGKLARDAAILKVLRAAPKSGIRRITISEEIAKLGIDPSAASDYVLQQLKSKKWIKTVTQGYWTIGKSAPSAEELVSVEPGPAVVTVNKPDESNNTRSIIIAYLTGKPPQSRLDTVAYVIGRKKMAKASARQSIKRMVADKEIHETATGMLSLPSR